MAPKAEMDLQTLQNTTQTETDGLMKMIRFLINCVSGQKTVLEKTYCAQSEKLELAQSISAMHKQISH